MTNRDLFGTEKIMLESLVDSTSLQSVLMALSEIASEKADHIRATYADHALAKAWDSAGGVVGMIVPDRHIQRLA